MRFQSLIPFLAVASAAPADPGNVDLCGLLGIDIDATPQSTLSQTFSIGAQLATFEGPTLAISDDDKAIRFRANQPLKFALKDGLLVDSKDRVVAGYVGDVGLSVDFRWFPRSKLNDAVLPLTVEARHVCNTNTGEAQLVIVPSGRASGQQFTFRSPTRKFGDGASLTVVGTNPKIALKVQY